MTGLAGDHPASSAPAARTTRRVLRGGLVCATAAAAGVSALRLSDGVLPQVVAFTPLLVPGLAVVTGLAAVTRARVVGGLAAALLALQAAWLAPQVLPQAPVGETATLTILSANAQIGGAETAPLLEAVAREQVDVLVVLELTVRMARRLERAGMSRLLPERVLEPGGGGAGAGIYSRLPISALGSVDGMTFAAPLVEIEVPGAEPLTLAAVHPVAPRPGASEAWRADLRRLTEWSAGAGPRVLLAGDFNASRDHGPFRALLGTGLEDMAEGGFAALVSPTWPADRWPLPPLVRIDHVLARDATATALEARTLALPGTDHRALLTRLAIR